MKIELYTLPSCGICYMIKTKLNEKGISFEEKDFSEIAVSMGFDQAPVLHIIENEDEQQYIITPSKMVEWIYKQ